MSENKTENLIYHLCFIAFAFPLLPNFLRNVLMALLVITVIISYFSSKVNKNINVKLIFLGSSLYLTYLLSMFWTDNIDLGLKKLSTGLPLLVFPIIAGLLSKDVINRLRNKIHYLLGIYAISVLLTFIVFFLIFIDHYGYSLFQHFPTLINKDLGPYNIHPIYMSMHGAVSIIISLYLLHKVDFNRWQLLLIILCDILIVCFMLILIKKGPIISMVISSAYLVLALKNRKIVLILSILTAILTSVIIFQPKVNRKFSELLNINNANKTELTSTNIRLIIYDCGKELVPDAGLFGFGVGDTREKLLDCYESKNHELLKSKYNSHNQFLSIILRSGFLGLFCYLLFLLYLFIKSLFSKSYLVIAILVFYTLVMLSENILEREDGVVYVSFITLILFVLFNYSNVEKITYHGEK